MKNPNIHIGKAIMQVMNNKDVTKAELARRLEVKPQSVDYLLKRESIDTHTLYSVSEVLEHDFFALFFAHKKQTNYDKIDFAKETPTRAKVLVEVELDIEDIIKLDLKSRVVQILNK
ncbi:hypothetical protein Barb6_01966 [Bacteroidales bacterium Barb6]|nr:hypothetical protein Barb6_01966 [Bacteroidales bacterium Barb6]